MNRDYDQEDLDALLAALPHHMAHLPARLVFDDLSVLIDAWKSVREVPASDPDRRCYYGSLATDMPLIDELMARLIRFRSERLWWLSLPHSDPPPDLDPEVVVDVTETSDDRILRLLHGLAGRLSDEVDREKVLDTIKHLAKRLVDDSAQYAIVKTVESYRLRKWPEETDDDAIERLALEELRAMSRHRSNEKNRVVQQVRADLLAGRMTRRAAIERIGLPAWTSLCTTLSDDELQQVLGGDA